MASFSLFNLISAQSKNCFVQLVHVDKSEFPEEEFWKVPQTFDEFKEFVQKESQYQFWARCEYEIILVDWPCQKHEEKWDVYQQIMMNLDLVTKTLMEELNDNQK